MDNISTSICLSTSPVCIGQTCHHHIIIPTNNLDGNIVSCLHVSSSDTHKILSKSSATHNMLASTKIDQNKLTSHPAGHSQGHCSSYQRSPAMASSSSSSTSESECLNCIIVQENM